MDGHSAEELHSTICGTYQNILDLSPVLKEVAAASKQYYKSLQNVSSSSLAFQQALAKLSQMASSSKGPAKPLGLALEEIVTTHRDVEARRADILKFMWNDFVIPLDSLVESDQIYVKSVQKNYQQDNKTQTECVEKAKNELLKIRKKSQRKKPTEKYEEKEKQCEEQLTIFQKQLEMFRREACTKSLSEEWKRYCFVVDRASIVLKSCMDFYDHNAAMLLEKIPKWFALVKKKPEGQANTVTGNNNLGPAMQSKVKLQAIFKHEAAEASQLSFKEGDIIEPVSDVVAGWQYGENLKTQKSGWFPAAYTQEIIAVATGSSVSQTMPVSGVHSRPVFDSGPGHRSLKRFASEGPATMALPLPDYGDAQTTNEIAANGETSGPSEPESSNKSSEPDSTPATNAPPSDSPSTTTHTAPQPPTPTTPKTHPQLGPPPPPPPPPPTPPPDEDNSDKTSPFANVTLKKTETSDRSAPQLV
ncbi:brain-specific angiogenesis inhibitor 1-associated protein 2 isoform X2 [Nematostella vectensis]|nr:brain-specific angiogenesis inhibitor 1-associated protein 2 isoform X2 [Nematostella vectensis]